MFLAYSRASILARSTLARLGLGAVLEFFMPRHLDGFELAFVGSCGIALEIRQFSHVAVQVGEADGEGIDFRMSFGEPDADVFGVVPG